MDPLPTSMPYTGPRPSPARRWAPVLEVVVGAVVLANVILFVLNLIERHNLTRARAGRPVSHAFFEDTLSTINALNRIVLVLMLAFLALDIVWVNRRRGPGRRREFGETGVEPPLNVVSSTLWAVFWGAFVGSIVAFAIARANSHAPMSIDDFIAYRTWIAIAAAFRAATWSFYLALVVAATRMQDRREDASAPPAPAPPLPPPMPPAPSPV